jgi:hypothetical protein
MNIQVKQINPTNIEVIFFGNAITIVEKFSIHDSLLTLSKRIEELENSAIKYDPETETYSLIKLPTKIEKTK